MPTLLDDFEREDHNALYSAIQECGIDDAIARQAEPHGRSCYFWMEHTPTTTMTVQLVEMLKSLGFEIQRSPALKEGE